MLLDAIGARDRWVDSGQAVAAATVVRTWGSSPWPPGARFVVSDRGDTHGSVSGGCVEEDLRLRALRVIESGHLEMTSYGVSNEEAFEVGLACGGTIEIFVQTWDDPVLDAVRDAVVDGRSVILATALDGGAMSLMDPAGSIVAGPAVPSGVTDAGDRVLVTRGTEVVETDAGNWFVEAVVPPPRLIVLGAISVADALVPMAAAAGFDVTVVDSRLWLATADRYPQAADVICGDPREILAELPVDGSTAIVSFLHEARLEDPVLAGSLVGSAAYVGAMGSRSSSASKRERLIASGVPAEVVATLRAPIGLGIGAVTPAEIAVAVLAEVVSVLHGSR